MKITFVQSRGLVNDPIANFYKARMRINNVDSDIFVFPEMFCSGYISDEKHMHINNLKKLIYDNVQDLCKVKGCSVIIGSPTERDGKKFDSALLINPEGTTVYDKVVLCSDGAFDETAFFTAGNRPVVIDHDGVRIGLMVGDDLLSTELMAAYMDEDVHIIVDIAAMDAGQMDRLEKIAASKAAQNHVPIIVCNMIGDDCGHMLCGRSMMMSSDGTAVEKCTDGSDVREIRLNPDELNANISKRVRTRNIKLEKCETVKSGTSEPDTSIKSCPYGTLPS